MAAARILLVDDEAALVTLVSRALTTRGFNVVSTTDPKEALEVARRDPPPDLVVSDVVMPGLSGPELVREIKRLRPQTPALLMSGYAAETPLPRDVPFLPKPFTMDVLFRKVDEVLARANAARADLHSEAERAQDLRQKSQELRADSDALRQESRAICERAKRLCAPWHSDPK